MASVKYNIYLWRRNFLSWKWKKSLGFILLYINLHVAYISVSLNPTASMYSDTTCDLYVLFMSRGCTTIPTNAYKSAILPLAFITDLPFLIPPCRARSLHSTAFWPVSSSHTNAPTPSSRLQTKLCTCESLGFCTKNPENLTSTIRSTRRKFTKFNVIRKSGCAPHATNVTWVMIWCSLCKLCNAIGIRSPSSSFSPFMLSKF